MAMRSTLECGREAAAFASPSSTIAKSEGGSFAAALQSASHIPSGMRTPGIALERRGDGGMEVL